MTTTYYNVAFTHSIDNCSLKIINATFDNDGPYDLILFRRKEDLTNSSASDLAYEKAVYNYTVVVFQRPKIDIHFLKMNEVKNIP